MKLLNNKGSVLQVVLVTFMVMTFSLTVGLFMINQNTNHYQQIDLLMKQKNLEILLTKYYVESMQNDILLSDNFMDDHYSLSSMIDDLGTYYEITTTLTSEDMNYSFLLQIQTETFEVTKFEYLEG
ncbi:hypothetical protein [Candidatus Stoquefichus massiliensis]|uniref:hypothetical protein n=1 Tax=Candidatus Stoquefichus massiliensis TaxID=1470350 RepID=UPI000488B76C|nr:hypothetical protein [Candidatus Stoquefichus massiliensis]